VLFQSRADDLVAPDDHVVVIGGTGGVDGELHTNNAEATTPWTVNASDLCLARLGFESFEAIDLSAATPRQILYRPAA